MLRQYVENLEYVNDKPFITNTNNTTTVQQWQDNDMRYEQAMAMNKAIPTQRNQISGAEANIKPSPTLTLNTPDF
jgi:macrodomain Ter protein organizer (MatP/YcbG family)